MMYQDQEKYDIAVLSALDCISRHSYEATRPIERLSSLPGRDGHLRFDRDRARAKCTVIVKLNSQDM